MSSGAACNAQLSLFRGCTLEVCCRAQSFLHYAPSLPQNAAYLAIFALFLLIQTVQGIRYRTWGFAIGCCAGLILEVIGYGGRLKMRSDPFNLSTFLLSFIPIGLGPAWMAASIYLTLARVVCTYSPTLSRIRPRTYTLAFVAVDISSIVIQAVGGSLTAATRSDTDRARYTGVLIAGLALQAVSLGVFIVLGTEYVLRARRASPALLRPEFASLRASTRFNAFLIAVAVAAATIFVRCVYRVVELCQGFDGALANEEVPFMVLEGPMIMLAMLCLTIWHPGVVYGASWADADWSFRGDGQARSLRNRSEMQSREDEPPSEESSMEEKEPGDVERA